MERKRYFHENLNDVTKQMIAAISRVRPEDPLKWMIEYIVKKCIGSSTCELEVGVKKLIVKSNCKMCFN